MAGNAKPLRDAVEEALMVEPDLAQAEIELHSSEINGHAGKLRKRMQELLQDAPARPSFDGFMGPDLEPRIVKSLRAAFEESLGSNATLAQAEMDALGNLGLEKLGEFRTAIRGHLSSEAELADRDLAIYVKAGEGRKTAFQRALEENLRDLGERPPFDRATAGEGKATAPALSAKAIPKPAQEASAKSEAGSPESPAPPAGMPSRPGADEHQVKSLTLSSVQPDLSEREGLAAAASEAGIAWGPRMEPIPLLTAALEAVGFAEDDFGFVLRYGRYAQPGRNSEFLVGGVGLSDLSDRLAGWLEAQGANDCEVQVLDDGSGELMIYLLGHDRPIASPPPEYESE